jgi:hypothetical protein
MKRAIKKTLIKLLIALPILLFFAWLKLDYILERILFQPTALDKNYAFQFTHAFEEINLNPEKDVLINALYFKVNNPKGVLSVRH